jgi:hypothetical protein
MQKISGGCQCGAIPKGSLKFEGIGLATYEHVGDSGLPVFRKFCPKCGSPILSEAAAAPTMDWIKAGTLDDTSWLRPEINLWCDSAQAWLQMNEDIPRHPRNPSMLA